MVIAKNLTLAQAWGILDLARTNKTNNVTAFPFFASSEFYTLGFSWEVSKLAANTSVVNGGNYSFPPPPPNWWQLFWNTIAGWAERAWNAALAVGAFFANVGKWLATAFMSVVKGLTTGDWTDFKNNVLRPLAKALDAFVGAIAALVQGMISSVLGMIMPPLRALYTWGLGLMKKDAESMRDFLASEKPGDLKAAQEGAHQLWEKLAPLEIVGTAVAVVFLAVQFVLGPVSFLTSMVMGIVIDLIVRKIGESLAGTSFGILGPLLQGDFTPVLGMMPFDLKGGLSSAALMTGSGALSLTVFVLLFGVAFILGGFVLNSWDLLMKVRNKAHGIFSMDKALYTKRALTFIFGTIFAALASFFGLAAAAEKGSEKIFGAGAAVVFGALGVAFLWGVTDTKGLDKWQKEVIEKLIPRWAKIASDLMAFGGLVGGIADIAIAINEDK